MPQLQGFQESRSGLRARDISPDSVIFTAESNFSLFSSSASGSVERCSFTSDVVVPDQDANAVSVLSQHLTGHELSEVVVSGGGPDPESGGYGKLAYMNSVGFTKKGKAKVQRLDSSEAESTEDEAIALDSARNSFSQALKECQDRRLRSEILLQKTKHRRPASVDFNNSLTNGGTPSSYSPRLVGIMKKQPTSTRKIGAFPSPGTPNYRHASVGVNKGWSSERIPLHSNPNRRSVNNFLYPYNGKTLPSKWEDAERWIFSPMSGDGMLRTSTQQQTQRRPKSKSGPLGPPGVAYYQMFSPAVTMLEGGNNNGKAIANSNSPFLAGTMSLDALSLRYEGARNFITGVEPCMARSISIHGCSETISQTTVQAHLDSKSYDATNNDAPNNISRVVSRRDMATQMSPESSVRSSPTRVSSSFSLATPSILPLVEIQSSRSSGVDMRDVSVDNEKVTMTRWPKKNRSKDSGRGSRNDDDWKRKAMSIRCTSWEVSTDSSRSISKVQREEAKITAWENLQKAKAEAAIRKLEMKLEKKRSSSMDKIVNKLRAAQKKAQEMRSAVIANQTSHQNERSSDKRLSFRRTKQIGSLSGCFTCPAF